MTRNIKKVLLFLVVCAVHQSNFSQSINTTINADAEHLVKEVFIGGGCFDIQNTQAIGGLGAIGTFNSGQNSIGLEEGIILSTGAIANAHGPNTATNKTTNFSITSTDPDVTALINNPLIPIRDVTILEFDFTPTTSQASFDYVFASEEYCDFVGTLYNDVFGFFISGPGINGSFSNGAENIAVVPGSTNFVAINNVNHLDNTAYYQDNIAANDNQLQYCTAYPNINGIALNNIEYDGFTTILNASAQVIPCETYHIKLIVADINDGQYDSAVFLGKNSFSAGSSVTVQAVVPSTESNITQEGCTDAYFLFERLGDDVSIPLIVNFSISGTATENTDFSNLGNNIIISAGETQFQLPVEAFFDGFNEGIENIILELDVLCSCSKPFENMLIQDGNPLMIESENFDVCENESYTIQPNISGGLPPFDFQWDNGATTPEITISPTADQFHQLTITDACGQSFSANYSIHLIPLPIANLAGEAVFCNGVQNGNLTINLIGEIPFEIYYTLDGNPQNPILTNEFMLNFPLNNSGEYVLTQVFGNGCEGTVSGEVEVLAASFQIESIIEDVKCTGEQNGKIEVDIEGGIPPYNLQWNNGLSNVLIIDNLASGEYFLTVTDAIFCEQIFTFSVEENLPLALFAEEISTITCNNLSGSINLSIYNGEAPYQFNWTNNIGSVEDSQNLAEGIYQVTVSDVNGCTISESFEILSNTIPPLVSIIEPSELDCTQLEISLNAIVSGGNFGFLFEWSTDNGNILSGQQAVSSIINQSGIYQIQVTDLSNGCTEMATIEVDGNFEVPEIELIATSQILDCENTEITLIGEVSSDQNYDYYWIGDGMFSDEETLFPIINEGGNYTLVVMNTENGCSNSSEIFIEDNTNNFQIQVEIPSNLSCNLPSIELDVIIFNLSDFSVLWQTLDGNIVDGANTIQPNINAIGTYEVIVTDNENGCTKSEIITVVGSTDLPTVEIETPEMLTCNQQEITLFSDENSNYEYFWTTQNGNITNGEITPNPSVDMPGEYFLALTDISNNCVANFSVFVEEDLTVSDFELFAASETICGNSPTNIFIEIYNPTGNETIVWTTENGNIINENDTEITVNSAGVYQVIIFNNLTDCTKEANIEITENTELAVNFSQSLVLCGGNPIVISPENNFATYQWSTGESDDSIEVENEGIYTVSVSNEQGCTGVGIAEVIFGEVPNPIIYGDSILCEGMPVMLSLNTDFLEILWSNDKNEIEISIEEEGLYSVEVMNEMGCSASAEFEVFANPLTAVEIIGSDNFCVGGSTILASNNNFELYSWSTGQVESSIEINSEDWYFLMVQDEYGCSSIDSIFVTEGDTLAIEIIGETTFCAGGSIILDGGAGFENYFWSTGETTQTIEIYEEGIYQLEVIFDSGCIGIGNILISATTLDAPQIFGEIQFCQNENSQLFINETEHDILWSTGEISSMIDVNQAGIFSVSITDENGCTSENYIEMETYSLPDFSLEGNGVICKDEPTIISLSNNYENVSWSSGENANTISGQEIGWYFVTVTNDFGCEKIDSIFVTETVDIDFSIIGNPFFCENGNTQISIDNDNLGLEWSTGENSPIIEITESGIFHVTVTDENGCVDLDSIFITKIPLPIADAGIDFSLTCQDSIVNLGGNQMSLGNQFEYTWEGIGIDESNANIPNPTVSQAGTYQLIIEDTLYNCSSFISEVSVFPFQLPQIELLDFDTLNCEKETILIEVFNQNAADNWIFTWTHNGHIIENVTLDSLEISGQGTYEISIIDTTNFCTISDSIFIFEDKNIPQFQIIGNTFLNCHKPQTQLNPEFFTPLDNFSFSWETIDGNFIESSPILSPMIDAAGIYFLLIVNEENHCQFVDSIIINSDFEPPIVEAGENRVFDCYLDSLVLETQILISTEKALIYWTNSQNEPIPNSPNFSVIIDEPNTYFVSVQNIENGCFGIDSIQIFEDKKAFINLATDTEKPVCFGEENGAILITELEGGTPPFQMSLNNNAYFDSYIFDNLKAGNYHLKITDARNCLIEQNIELEAGNDLRLELGEDLILKLGDSIQLQPLFNIPESDLLHFQWNTSLFLNHFDTLFPISKPLESITYQLEITDQQGCKETDQLNIFLSKELEIYYPNAFSPNGDGTNDYFTLFSNKRVEKIMNLKIFNRWGSLLFERDDFQPNIVQLGWDGHFQNKLMNAGTYTFFATILKIDGQKEIVKGTVHLIK